MGTPVFRQFHWKWHPRRSCDPSCRAVRQPATLDRCRETIVTSARNESHAVRLRGWRFLLAVAVAGVLALLATPSLCREAEAASPAVAPKAPTEVAARLRRDYPLDIDPIALTGTVHHLLGNSDEAVTCWQECVRRDPGRADARKHRETVKRLKAKGLPVSTGRPPASADDLASLRDGVARVHTVAGRFCHKRGNVDQAERHWRRAAEIDPTNAACRVHLAARLKVNPATTPEARRHQLRHPERGLRQERRPAGRLRRHEPSLGVGAPERPVPAHPRESQAERTMTA